MWVGILSLQKSANNDSKPCSSVTFEDLTYTIGDSKDDQIIQDFFNTYGMYRILNWLFQYK